MKKRKVSSFVLLCLIIIWIFFLLSNILYDSMFVGKVISDIYSAKATVSFNVVGEDTTLPTINSIVINPYGPIIGDDVFLDIFAMDNKGIDKKIVEITLPNKTSRLFNLPANYTIQLKGKHNLVFLANDTSGNIKTEEDFFIAGTIKKNITFNLMNIVSDGLLVILNIYIPDSNKKIDSYNSSETETSGMYADISYDLEYLTYEGNFNLRLKDINFFFNDNKELILDQITNFTNKTDLIIYAMQSTFNFSKAKITINCANINYTNIDYLELYKCEDWDFINQTCLGVWKVNPFTINKTTKILTFITSSFSSFMIKQGSAPIQQSPLNIGGGKAIIPPGIQVPNAAEEYLKEERINVSEEKPIEEIPKVELIEMPSPELIIIYNFYLIIPLFLLFILFIYLIYKQRKQILKKQNSFKKK